MKIHLEKLEERDWARVRQIYTEGIETGLATFETTAPDWERWNASHRPDCRIKARIDQAIVGWAALSQVSSRAVYHGVGEISIYVANEARGHGVGKALLRELIQQSEGAGIWTLQAGIFPENVSSISLHKTLGFREVGIRERIGHLAGVWRDVVLLERRSKVAGV
jgi:L-amino acid N-acyltransferase YncA